MMANRLTALLSKYERNFHNAYMTWYRNGLDEFLEPNYDPNWVLKGSPEIDWYQSEKYYPDMYVMRDGSIVAPDNSGIWHALGSDTCARW